jgi:dihydroneopterin aldolase
MLGTTGLNSLRIDCAVGVRARERAETRPISIDIEFDVAAAAAIDAVEDTVHQDAVAASVTKLIQRRQFRQIETMAEESAALLLDRRPPMHTVRLEIRKPNAVPATASPFVRLERSRV